MLGSGKFFSLNSATTELRRSCYFLYPLTLGLPPLNWYAVTGPLDERVAPTKLDRKPAVGTVQAHGTYQDRFGRPNRS